MRFGRAQQRQASSKNAAIFLLPVCCVYTIAKVLLLFILSLSFFINQFLSISVISVGTDTE